MVEVYNKFYSKCTLNDYNDLNDYVNYKLKPIFDAVEQNDAFIFPDGTKVKLIVKECKTR